MAAGPDGTAPRRGSQPGALSAGGIVWRRATSPIATRRRASRLATSRRRAQGTDNARSFGDTSAGPALEVEDITVDVPE
jgi:hypothetical protein